MTVRITEKELQRTVGPLFAREVFRRERPKVLLPRIEVVHLKRKVVSSIVREHWIASIAEEVEFLLCPQSEPRARKGERRPRDRFEPQDIPIKPAALLHVFDVDCDMI